MPFLTYIHIFSTYSQNVNLLHELFWWHLCCTVLISSDYCEVILRERSTPILGAAISEFVAVWCCFTSRQLDTAEGGGLRKQETRMGRAHVPKHTQKATHIEQTELGCLSTHGGS